MESKELALKYVTNGIHVDFNFKADSNPVTMVSYDPLKSAGRIATTVELLKNTSTTVEDPAPGLLYKNFNVWVGTGGYATSSNLENISIEFRVNKSC